MPTATSDLPAARTFECALAPMSLPAFVAEYWGQSFLRLPGHPGKFAALLPWCELDQILEAHRLAPPRLNLYQNGKALPPERFLGRRNDEPILNSAGLTNCLAAGASLVLNYVDELAPAVRAFAESVEDTLRLNCWANLYAGWRTQNAFDLHWDEHATLIVQVAGRKRWQIYRPTLLHPVRQAAAAPAPAPTEAPVWEGMLEDGDLIYMPRGWWHMAFPVDEPSLHLTFGANPRTGADLLKWLANQLGHHAEIRADLPHLAGPEAQQQHLARLRQVVADALQGEVISQCVAARETTLAPRPRVRLAEVTAGRGAALTMDTRVRLTTARQLAFDRAASEASPVVTFLVGTTRMKCARELVPALRRLSSTSGTVRELCDQLPRAEAAAQLKLLLAALKAGGLLATEPPATEPEG